VWEIAGGEGGQWSRRWSSDTDGIISAERVRLVPRARVTAPAGVVFTSRVGRYSRGNRRRIKRVTRGPVSVSPESPSSPLPCAIMARSRVRNERAD